MSNTTVFSLQTNDNGALFSFSDLNWRPFAPDKLDELGVRPNELWYHAITNAGALIVRKSNRYAEYALSQFGLDYVVTRLQAEKIQTGVVVLARSDGARRSVVTVKPVADVVAMLDGIPPRDGPLGSYWWLNPDCTPHGVRPPSDEGIPF